MQTDTQLHTAHLQAAPTLTNDHPLPLPSPLTHLLSNLLLILLIQHPRHLPILIPSLHKTQRGEVEANHVALASERVAQVGTEVEELGAEDTVRDELGGGGAEEEREGSGG